MKFNKALFTSVLASAFIGASAMAGPPVKVEVVIEDDEDFFSETPAPKTAKEKVKANADAMFDALEREEARHGKPSANKSNQVVNVIVQGSETSAEPAVPSVPVTPDRPLTRAERRALKRRLKAERRAERRAAKFQRAQEKLALKRQKLELRRQKMQLKQEIKQEKLKHRGWWNRPSWAEEGDILVHGKGSANGMGLFGGIGGEYMLRDWLGIRVGGVFGRVDGDDTGAPGPNFNFQKGGVWANPSNVDGSLQEGHVHLIDSALALHVIPRSRFDIFPNVGVGYMGYKMDYADRTEKGGAGYLRVGAGFNIVIKRFYAGLDFGWYPVEVFRHGDTPAVAGGTFGLTPAGKGSGAGGLNGSGGSGGSGSPQATIDDGGDGEGGSGRFDPTRMTLTAHVGMRF